MRNWLPTYCKNKLFSMFHSSPPGPRHIMFLFVDHFEVAGKEPRLRQWLEKYPKLAANHIDADGCHPKHTWFYALDLLREDELKEMRCLVEQNLGEVELHWHHGHDTDESFKQKLRAGLSVFQKHGFMRPIHDGSAGCFAFIHGNWSLDNSCGSQFCGIDNEIQLLIQAGCYADFTFPAMHSMAQPSMINTIYYAKDNGRPKSYNTGRPSQVGIAPSSDEFMIFQGPLTINWNDWYHKWHPTIENGEIGHSCTHSLPVRIDSWMKQNITVKGRPDWIFVKVFSHGGQDYTSVLGHETDKMHSYLRKKYNDGKNFFLHYVSTREVYNIVRAAEDGKRGNPNEYRDYIIPPPLER